MGGALLQAAPGAQAAERLGFDPVDLLAEHTVGEGGSRAAVRVGLAYHHQRVGAGGSSRYFFAAVTQDSPTVLQNSPGAMTSFQRS